jgi:hypothetical protein
MDEGESMSLEDINTTLRKLRSKRERTREDERTIRRLEKIKKGFLDEVRRKKEERVREERLKRRRGGRR